MVAIGDHGKTTVQSLSEIEGQDGVRGDSNLVLGEYLRCFDSCITSSDLTCICFTDGGDEAQFTWVSLSGGGLFPEAVDGGLIVAQRAEEFACLRCGGRRRFADVAAVAIWRSCRTWNRTFVSKFGLEIMIHLQTVGPCVMAPHGMQSEPRWCLVENLQGACEWSGAGLSGDAAVLTGDGTRRLAMALCS